MMRVLVLLVAATAAAEPPRPRFTINCDHDGWTCVDNFPAISRDHLTIAHAVTRGDAIVVELVSVATSRVLRRETAFKDNGRFPTEARVAKLRAQLREFRAMTRASEQGEQAIYTRGTVTLQIDHCEGATCRTTYRVTRRRR